MHRPTRDGRAPGTHPCHHDNFIGDGLGNELRERGAGGNQGGKITLVRNWQEESEEELAKATISCVPCPLCVCVCAVCAACVLCKLQCGLLGAAETKLARDATVVYNLHHPTEIPRTLGW